MARSYEDILKKIKSMTYTEPTVQTGTAPTALVNSIKNKTSLTTEQNKSDLKSLTKQKNTLTTKKNNSLNTYKDYLDKNGVKYNSVSIGGNSIDTQLSKPYQERLKSNTLTKYTTNSAKDLLSNDVKEEQQNKIDYSRIANTSTAKNLQEEILSTRDEESKVNNNLQQIKAQMDYDKWHTGGIGGAVTGTAYDLLATAVNSTVSFFDYGSNMVRNENGEAYQLSNYSDMYNAITQENSKGLKKIILATEDQLVQQGWQAVINSFTGGSGGTALYYANIMNDQYNEALQEGYSADKATAYALFDGFIQYEFEKNITGNSWLYGDTGLLEGTLSKGISKVSTNTVLNSVLPGFLKTVLNSKIVNELVSSAGSNFAEEWAEEFIGQIDKNLTLNFGEKSAFDDVFTKERAKDALFSGLVGALSGGIGKRGEQITSTKSLAEANNMSTGAITAVQQAVYDQQRGVIEGIERANDGKISEANENLIWNIAKTNDDMAKEFGIKQSNQEKVEDITNLFSDIKQKQMNEVDEEFKKFQPKTDEAIQKTQEFKDNVKKVVFDTNLSVKFDTSLKNNKYGINGYTDANTIVVNPYSPNAMRSIILHEMAHHFTSDSTVNFVVNYAKNNKLESGETIYDNLKQNLLETGYTEEQIDDEITSIMVGDVMGTDKFVTDLVNGDLELAKGIKERLQRIANTITGQSNDAFFFKDLARKFSQDYENMTDKMVTKGNDGVLYNKSGVIMSDETDANGDRLSAAVAARYKNSKAREDENGNYDPNGKLVSTFHTTNAQQFNVFDPIPKNGEHSYKFGDDIVIYTTSDYLMSRSYAMAWEDIREADASKFENVDDAMKWLKSLDGFTSFKQEYENEFNDDLDISTNIDNNGNINVKVEPVYGDIHFEKKYSPEEFVRNIKEDIYKNYGASDGTIYEGYSNIENPLVVDAKDSAWSEVIRDNKNKLIGMKNFAEKLKSNDKIKEELTNLYNKCTSFPKDSNAEYDKRLDLINNGFKDSKLINDLNQILDYGLDVEGLVDENGNDIYVNDELKDNYKNKKYENMTLKEYLNEMFELVDSDPRTIFANGIRNIFNENNFVIPDGVWKGAFKRDQVFMTDAVAMLVRDNFEVKDKKLAKYLINMSTNDVVNRALALNKNGANYDGVIIEHVYDYGDGAYADPDFFQMNDKSHNLYIMFNPNQFKLKDNLNPTDDPDIRYSKANQNLEDTKKELKNKLADKNFDIGNNLKDVEFKDILADDNNQHLLVLHGLSQDNFRKLVKSEGRAPMLSLAITNIYDEKNLNYGDVYFIFNKDTIDPQKDERNKVYSGDRWTIMRGDLSEQQQKAYGEGVDGVLSYMIQHKDRPLAATDEDGSISYAPWLAAQSFRELKSIDEIKEKSKNKEDQTGLILLTQVEVDDMNDAVENLDASMSRLAKKLGVSTIELANAAGKLARIDGDPMEGLNSFDLHEEIKKITGKNYPRSKFMTDYTDFMMKFAFASDKVTSYFEAKPERMIDTVHEAVGLVVPEGVFTESELKLYSDAGVEIKTYSLGDGKGKVDKIKSYTKAMFSKMNYGVRKSLQEYFGNDYEGVTGKDLNIKTDKEIAKMENYKQREQAYIDKINAKAQNKSQEQQISQDNVNVQETKKVPKTSKKAPTNNVQNVATQNIESQPDIQNIKLDTTKNNEGRSNERKTYKSIIESNYQSKEAKQIAKKLMGNEQYITLSNKKSLEEADKHINNVSPDKALEQLKTNVLDNKVNVYDVAIGDRLIQYYSKVGDETKLNEAIQNTALVGTIAGRTVQAMSLIKRQSPQGQAIFMQKVVDTLNKQLQNKGSKQQYNLTEEMISTIVHSSKKDLAQNVAKVETELGQQVSASLGERVDAWRYFSMLSSPTTHIRNIVGNISMNLIQNGKYIIQGGLEDVVIGKKGERTTTLKMSSEETREFAAKDVKKQEVQDLLGVGENKYNEKNAIKSNNKMALKKVYDIVSNTLEAEDAWGLKSMYRKALSNYITANNWDVRTMTDKQLHKARMYAVNEAKVATFHQDSQLANKLTQLGNINTATKVAMGALVPFKKTPINVAKTGIDYSPIGLAKTLTKNTYQLNQGTITANEYIDNISKGLTGSLIFGLGMVLASAGVIRTSSDDDDDEYYEEDKGNQSFSLTVGDTNISLDWLSPTAIPLFMGAELVQQFENAKSTNGETLEQNVTSILDSSMSVLNPLSEMTMISGLTDVLKSLSYSGDTSKMIETLGSNTASTFANQFVPSVLGKVAKITDRYERSTATTSQSTAGKMFQKIWNSTKSKVPILRNTLPVKTDAWGEDVTQAVGGEDNSFTSILKRTEQNLLDPATIKSVRNNDLDNEITRLYNATGESGVIPETYGTKKYTNDDKTYVLTNTESANIKKAVGQANAKAVRSFMKTTAYLILSDAEKVEAIQNIYNYNSKTAEYSYYDTHDVSYEATSSYSNALEVESNGGDLGEYYAYKEMVSSADDDTSKATTLKFSGISDKTKKVILSTQILSDTSTGKKALVKVLDELDYNVDDYLGYYGTKFTGTKDKYGNTVTGSVKNERINYLDSSNLSYYQELLVGALDFSVSDSQKDEIYALIMSSDLTEEEKLNYFKSAKGFTVKGNNVEW